MQHMKVKTPMSNVAFWEDLEVVKKATEDISQEK